MGKSARGKMSASMSRTAQKQRTGNRFLLVSLRYSNYYVIQGSTGFVPWLVILTNQIALYQVNNSQTNLVCKVFK